MGIRESLDRQPESEKDLNLKNFTMPKNEPEQEFYFDIEKEISEEDWQEIKKVLDDVLEKGDNAGFFLAEDIKTIAPEKELDINTDQNWQVALNRLLYYCNKTNHRMWAISHAKIMKALFPERMKKINLDEYFQAKGPADNSDIWTEIIVRIVSSYKKSNGNSMFIAKDIADIKLISLDKFNQLNFDESNLQHYIKELNKLRIAKEWSGFIEFASYLLIIAPEKKGELGLDKIPWSKINIDYLARHRYGRPSISTSSPSNPDLDKWTNKLDFLAKVKIVCAKEVKITDQRLELIMPDKKSHQQKIPPRPERRT